MKKLGENGFAHLVAVLVVVVIVGIAGTAYLVASHADSPNAAKAPDTSGSTATKPTGNGAPNGAHFNLEIIGVPQAKTATITSGNRIFVPLEGVCKINLTPGDFSVLDGNCSDNSPAAFQLPNPDPDGDGATNYTVWARPLGKPGGKATATTCATDPTTGEELCSIESSAFVRNKGKSSFENVSKGFLTVLVDLDGDPATAPERLSIFDDRLQDYFWNYDNGGLKNLQVRFYQN
jgi:hypothetical protein